jgi:succinoglycan biosynthesis transport protein ExoP
VRQPGQDREGSLEVRRLLEVPLRRPLHVLVPVVLLALVALILGITLPKRYATSTLILVESQKVPDAFMGPGQEAQRPRLQTSREEILSRTRLERIIEELNPYPEMIGKAAATEVIETMRAAVSINVKGSDAFMIEYVHRDPKVAQAVANRLAGLFIEETVRAREDQVVGAASFLDAQLNDARQQLERKEKDLRQYKEANMGRLPEQMQANLATLQRLQMEQQSVSANLQSARERLVLLERGREDLVAAVPGRTSSPSPGDPSVELVSLRSQLASLRERYTEEHPDVKALASRVKHLEAGLAQSTSAPAPGVPVGNSARVQQAQIEIESLVGKLADVEARIRTFQQRVEEAPRTEQELANLTRDYQKLNENYLTMFNKRLDAQMAERLERRWKGEQFRVLDPAFLPEEPYFPNRTLFLAIGLFLGFGIGLASAFVAEFLDSSVKSVRDLEALAPLPVLASIPTVGVPGAGVGTWSFLMWRLSGGRGRDLQAAPPPPSGGPQAEPSEEAVATASVPLSPPGGPEPAFEEVTQTHARPANAAAAVARGRGHTAEEFRSLAARLQALDASKPLRCIGVVSSVVGEGKSTVATGLAAALAQTSARVLLIEADVRRGVLDSYLGLRQLAGLSDWLANGDGPVGVRRILPSGFLLLSAGRTLDRSFDFVIVDCPPLLPVADSVMLQRLVDGFVVVVRERHAPLETILQALDRLDASQLRGVVLNDHFEVLSRYRKYQTAYYRRQ